MIWIVQYIIAPLIGVGVLFSFVYNCIYAGKTMHSYEEEK